jgi:DNA recombination-dependent growth factor C
MEFTADDKPSPVEGMIHNIVFNDNLMLKLKATDVVINALEPELADKVKAREFQQFIHNIFKNRAFIRRLTYLSYLKTNIETSLEYHGQDYATNPDFDYDEDMEAKMILIEKKLSRFLGELLKELNKGEKIEF